MTVVTKSHSNGVLPRKSLNMQLDRLDQILDGLDGALSGAITEAVKEAVVTGVSEAVRATLLEIVANPQILTLLRGVTTPQPTATEPEVFTNKRPSFFSKLRQHIAAAKQLMLLQLNAAVQAVRSRAAKTQTAVVDTLRQATVLWAFKRPIAVSLLAGAAVGILSYASSPWLAGVVGGISATAGALGMQLALFTRRMLTGLSAQ